MKLENKELSEHHKNLDGIEDYEYHEMSMWLQLRTFSNKSYDICISSF